ncbi:MAG: GAF domain-containing protein [Candidatus Aminicenantia bacterium]
MRELTSEEIKIRELESKVTQLSILYSIASSVGISTNAEEVLNLVIDKAMDNLSPEIGIIFLLDSETNELSATVARGIDIKDIDKVKLGEEIVGMVALKGEPIEIENISKSKAIDSFLKSYPVKSVFCYPIKANKKVLGTIHLSKFKSFSLTEEERWILMTLATRAGIAVESANLYKKLKEEKEKLEAIVQSMSEGLVVSDSKNKIVLINQAAQKLLGVKSEEVIGQNFEKFHPNPEKVRRIVADVHEQNRPYKTTIRRGENFLNLSISPIKDIQGKSIGTALVLLDVTEKTKVIKELKERNIELQKFHDITINRELKMIELKKEIKKLKQKLEGDQK